MQVRIPASGGVGALEMAVTVSRGVEVEPLLPSLSGAIHQAVVACPTVLADVPADSAVQFAFKVEDGKIRGSTVSAADPDKCIAGALDGKPIAGAQGKLDLIIQLRYWHLPSP